MTDPVLEKFLNYIREGIYEQPDRLKELFVRFSTTTSVPDEQRSSFGFAAIDYVEKRLQEFVTDDSTNGEAIFLVGKKGTGKSTLAYHVAEELQKDQKVYYAAVDYTMQVSTSTINTRLDPILGHHMNQVYSVLIHETPKADTPCVTSAHS